MTKENPVSHLSDSFFITPRYARQIMTHREWQETAKATQCRILAAGETYELTVKHMGGGMYEVRTGMLYWRDGKPKRGEAEK